MLKSDICITVIGQAFLEIFQLKVDILRKKSEKSLNVSDLLVINLQQIHHISVI